MASEDDGREARMRQAQMEALGLGRREEVITSETTDNSYFIPNEHLQSLRRHQKAGTAEAKAVKGKEDALSAWNTAWTSLQKDGTVEDGLEDVGTGTGQSHRHKLWEDASVQQYIERGDVRGDYRNVHRGGSSNKGGLSSQTGKLIVKQQVIPITRKRVPKGQSTSMTSAKVGTAPVFSSAGKVNNKYDSDAATKASKSFQRQQRQYGSSINLAEPSDFMASVRRVTPASALLPNSRSSPFKAGPSEKATTTTNTVTAIVPPKPKSLLETNAVAKAIAKSEAQANSFPADVQTEELAPQAAFEPNVQGSPTLKLDGQSSFLNLLPPLKEMLSPEQYAVVEAAASSVKPSTSSTIMPVAMSPAAASPEAVVEAANISPSGSPPPHPVAAPPAPRPFGKLAGQESRPLDKQLSVHVSASAHHIGANDVNKLAQNALNKKLQLCVDQRSPQMFKCMIKECTKAFRSHETWEKHVGSRHIQWLEELKSDVSTHTQQMVKAGLENEEGFVEAESPVAPASPSFGKAKSPTYDEGANARALQYYETKEGEAAQIRLISPPAIASHEKEDAPPWTTIIETTSNAASNRVTPDTRDSRRSLAESLARQRQAIIGEHVVKTRFLPAASMIDRFENLGITAAAPAALSPKTSNATPKATVNPLGPPEPAVSTDDSAPAVLSFQPQPPRFRDPGTTAHAQHWGISSAIEPAKFSSVGSAESAIFSPPTPLTSPPASRRAARSREPGPSLPAFLQGVTASADPGEAARLQYGATEKKREDPLEVARKRGL